MLKLLKYEFRKALTSLIILLSVTAGLEAYFLASLYTKQEIPLVISCFLLLLATYAVAIFAFIRGVTTYSGEMKSRSAYLIFMTPNSGLKIMASKYLYTFLNGLLFAALYLAMGVMDIGLLLGEMGDIQEFMETLKDALMQMGFGVRFDQIALAVIAFGLYFFLQVLSLISLAYMAITLSHTLFRDKKWRWLAAIALFMLLYWLLGRINGLLPNVYEEMTYVEPALSMQIQEKYGFTSGMGLTDVLVALLPQAGVSLAVILLSLFGCAWMLDRKVSL